MCVLYIESDNNSSTGILMRNSRMNKIQHFSEATWICRSMHKANTTAAIITPYTLWMLYIVCVCGFVFVFDKLLQYINWYECMCVWYHIHNLVVSTKYTTIEPIFISVRMNVRLIHLLVCFGFGIFWIETILLPLKSLSKPKFSWKVLFVFSLFFSLSNKFVEWEKWKSLSSIYESTKRSMR